LTAVLTPLPSPALTIIIIILGVGKICQKKQDQTGPQPTRFQTFHFLKLSLKV
jgi:hypothetical protein